MRDNNNAMQMQMQSNLLSRILLRPLLISHTMDLGELCSANPMSWNGKIDKGGRVGEDRTVVYVDAVPRCTGWKILRVGKKIDVGIDMGIDVDGDTDVEVDAEVDAQVDVRSISNLGERVEVFLKFPIALLLNEEGNSTIDC